MKIGAFPIHATIRSPPEQHNDCAVTHKSINSSEISRSIEFSTAKHVRGMISLNVWVFFPKIPSNKSTTSV